MSLGTTNIILGDRIIHDEIMFLILIEFEMIIFVIAPAHNGSNNSITSPYIWAKGNIAKTLVPT